MSIGDKWFSPQIAQGGDTPQSRVYRQLTNWLMLVCIILLTVNSARIVYRSIFSEKPFVDEIGFIRTYADFFKAFGYSNDGITKLNFWILGSGIAGSGLGGAVFSLGGDLLHSRAIVSAFDALAAVLIGVCLFRRWSIQLLPALLGASLIWSATVTTPFALPYWLGFTYNLGELPGALWIGLGLVAVTRRPHLAALCWGVAAWLTRLMWLPVPLLLTLASALTLPRPLLVKVQRLATMTLMFLMPMVAWLLVCTVLFGVAEATGWLVTALGYIGLGKQGFYAIEIHPSTLLASAGNPFSVSRLMSRLQNPHLEWSQGFYTLGTKLKVVSLSLGSIAVTLLGLYKQRPADRRPFTTLASSVLMVVVLAYTYWWFMLHPTMWMRHFQPALYIGLGLWIFWLLQISMRFSLFDRPFFRWGATAFVTAFVAWQAYFSWGISTRISDFPTQYRCRIHRFVLVNTVEMTCKKAHKQ